MQNFSVSIEDLRTRIGTAAAPSVIDVRRPAVMNDAKRMLPASTWRDISTIASWADAIPQGQDTVVYCAHGHNVSQLAVAELRARGRSAFALEGGIDAWLASGAPSMAIARFPHRPDGRGTRWVTRVRPKIDRIACPWLIRRHIDPLAQFYFVEPAWVLEVADEMDAIAFDVEGAELSHRGETCTFDTLIAEFDLDDPALGVIAQIVRGADTARLDLAPAAAGLLAVSLGISALAGGDDHGALRHGFPVYDALYAWQNLARGETHNWPAAGTKTNDRH